MTGSVSHGHFHSDRSVCSVSALTPLVLPHESLFSLYPHDPHTPNSILLLYFQNPSLGLRPQVLTSTQAFSKMLNDKGQRHGNDGETFYFFKFYKVYVGKNGFE